MMAWSCHYQPRSDSDVGSSRGLSQICLTARYSSARRDKNRSGAGDAAPLFLVIYPRFLFRQARWRAACRIKKKSVFVSYMRKEKVDRMALLESEAALPCAGHLYIYGTANTNQMVVEFYGKCSCRVLRLCIDAPLREALTAAAARQVQHVLPATAIRGCSLGKNDRRKVVVTALSRCWLPAVPPTTPCIWLQMARRAF